MSKAPKKPEEPIRPDQPDFDSADFRDPLNPRGKRSILDMTDILEFQRARAYAGQHDVILRVNVLRPQPKFAQPKVSRVYQASTPPAPTPSEPAESTQQVVDNIVVLTEQTPVLLQVTPEPIMAVVADQPYVVEVAPAEETKSDILNPKDPPYRQPLRYVGKQGSLNPGDVVTCLDEKEFKANQKGPGKCVVQFGKKILNVPWGSLRLILD